MEAEHVGGSSGFTMLMNLWRHPKVGTHLRTIVHHGLDKSTAPQTQSQREDTPVRYMGATESSNVPNPRRKSRRVGHATYLHVDMSEWSIFL